MDGIPAFVYRQKGLIAHLACGLDAYAGEIAKLQRSLAALQMEFEAPVLPARRCDDKVKPMPVQELERLRAGPQSPYREFVQRHLANCGCPKKSQVLKCAKVWGGELDIFLINDKLFFASSGARRIPKIAGEISQKLC